MYGGERLGGLQRLTGWLGIKESGWVLESGMVGIGAAQQETSLPAGELVGKQAARRAPTKAKQYCSTHQTNKHYTSHPAPSKQQTNAATIKATQHPPN